MYDYDKCSIEVNLWSRLVARCLVIYGNRGSIGFEEIFILFCTENKNCCADEWTWKFSIHETALFHILHRFFDIGYLYEF